MQSPMPLTTGASTARLSALSVIASPPLPTTAVNTSPAGLLEADREAAGAGAVLGGEVGGEAVRILVDQEVDAALAVDGDRPGLVVQHGGEAQLAEIVVQELALARRGGEFDEFEAVDAERVLERGDLHAEVGLRIHGIVLR